VIALIGDCTCEETVEGIFGSVSEFARQVELHGDNFVYNGINVLYDSIEDIHCFVENFNYEPR